MKIAILTLGTRGDVQPYAVLGQALRQRGHEVILSTLPSLKFKNLMRDFYIFADQFFSNKSTDRIIIYENYFNHIMQNIEFEIQNV